jgi:hypothetical protein
MTMARERESRGPMGPPFNGRGVIGMTHAKAARLGHAITQPSSRDALFCDSPYQY